MKCAKFVCEVKVYDPDSHSVVNLAVFKEEQSGGMFGIDASYLDAEEVLGTITSLFGNGSIQLIEEELPKSIVQKRVRVVVERHNERYRGEYTGKMIYHVMETGQPSRLFKGCPLGRGYTEQESLSDFCHRANLDDDTLKLNVKELDVVRPLAD
jgi:hypothetical protein